MRIEAIVSAKVVLLNEHLLYWTGGVKWILEMSKRLKCDVFVTKASSENKMLFNQVGIEVKEFADVSINDARYWIFYPYFLWDNWRKLKRLLVDYNVIISTSPTTCLIGAFLNKKSIFVMFEPNVWVYSPDFIEGLHPVLRLVARVGHPVIKWLDRFAMRRAGKLVALDGFRAKQGEKIYGRHVEIIPIGVDTELFKPQSKPASSGIIFHVATYLSPVKGTYFIIVALPQIIKEVPDCQLWILNAQGQQDERIALIFLAKRLGVDSYIKFLDRVSEETLPAYYSYAQIVVQPSFFTSHYWPILEGGACETLAIAFDGVNAHEGIIDGETGYLVPAGNVEALADKIIEVLKNPNPEMGRKAREMVIQRFSWERSAKLMSELVGTC